MNDIFIWNGSTSKGYVVINGQRNDFTVIDPTLAGFINDVVLYEPSLGNTKVLVGTVWRNLTSTEIGLITTFLTNYVMPPLSYCADATTLLYAGQVPLTSGLIAVSGPPADASMVWSVVTNSWVAPPKPATPINYQQEALAALLPYFRPNTDAILTAMATALNDAGVNAAMANYTAVGTQLNQATVISKINAASATALQSLIAILSSNTVPLTVSEVAALVNTL